MAAKRLAAENGVAKNSAKTWRPSAKEAWMVVAIATIAGEGVDEEGSAAGVAMDVVAAVVVGLHSSRHLTPSNMVASIIRTLL